LKRLKLIILFELKGMKIYAIQFVISLLIMPGILLAIMLLSGGTDRAQIVFGATGFIVATMVSSFIGLLALRICNMMMPEILELYATFALSRSEMVLGMSITYLLLMLPQIIIAAVVTGLLAPWINLFLFIGALLLSVLTIMLVSICLGLWVKNYFLAMGLFPLFTWVFLFLSPAYYDPIVLGNIFDWVLQINPLTQCLNLIRQGIGIGTPIPIGYSIGYLCLICLLAFRFINRSLGSMFILEKYY
jgi:ABC-2 type transport system permease protein